MPATTMRSSGLSPLSITRRSPTLGPIVTLRCSTVLLRTRTKLPGTSTCSAFGRMARTASVPVDRIRFELLRGHAEAPHVSANVQHLLFVDIEVHVNRSSLDDVGELGGAIGPHQFAQRHQARRDDAVEGSLYLGVAEVERGLRGIDLRLLEPARAESRLAVALSSACF